MAELALGIDVGGTNVRFGLVSSDGEITARSRARTDVHGGVKDVIGRINKGIAGLMGQAGAAGDTVAGIGVGVAGIIDAAGGVVRFSPNLPGWVDVPLEEEISAAAGLPVFVENDANAYALGEAWKGAGRDIENLVVMTLGTGVGGGVILGGRLWRGADGMAGEVGHITVSPNGPKCGCGSRGCLEMMASATAVVNWTLRALSRGKKSSLSPLYEKDEGLITAAAIKDAAVAGDALSIKAYDNAGKYLGIAAAGLVNLLNVERIIMGGGMSGAWELFSGAMRREFAARALKIPAARCEIVTAMLGDDAAIIGSAGLVFGKGR